jgi:hypothetical protein
MPCICPADGHVVDDPQGPYCQAHGVPWFLDCPTCGVGWPTKASGRYAITSLSPLSKRERGSDFCASCGAPCPWLTRPQLIEWMRSNVKAAAEVPTPARHELLDILARLEAMDANDTKAVAGWQRISEVAPKVWKAAKPVRDALVGEAVKKALEALGL